MKILVALGMLVIALATGCGPASVLFTFDNQTDLVLCDLPTADTSFAAQCLAVIEPNASTKWGRDCDGESGRPIRMVIVVQADQRVIYDTTASCGEWEGNGTIVIRQDGSNLVVTDELER